MNRLLLFKVPGSICNDLINTMNSFIEESLQEQGIHCDYVDWSDSAETISGSIAGMISNDYDAALCFNSVGQHNVLLSNGESVFDHYDVPFYNWILDSPLERFTTLNSKCVNYHVLCMDRDHESIIRRYCPDVKSVHFLPLGGLPPVETDLALLRDRDFDIVFTAGFQKKSPREFLDSFKKMDEPIRSILLCMADHMLRNNLDGVEKALSATLLELYGTDELPAETIRLLLPQLSPVADFMRIYTREKVLRALARAPLDLHLFGDGWEERLGQVDPHCCFHPSVIYSETAKIYSRSRIVLNVQPCFCNGTHDRIGSGMLQAAVTLTDHSRYLDEIHPEGLCFYDIDQADRLPDLIRDMLSNDIKMQETADKGFAYAESHLGWKTITEKLIQIMDENL
ncbi:MAG: hypothetical protein K5697_07515 [Lachnospiraceae bacterium]|nr:hypothetical protein [Lachnospiraceae bacterium]